MLRKEKKCTPLDCWAVPFLVSRCPWFRNHPWFQNHFFWFQNHSWLQNHRLWFQNHPVLVAESSLVSESFLILSTYLPTWLPPSLHPSIHVHTGVALLNGKHTNDLLELSWHLSLGRAWWGANMNVLSKAKQEVWAAKVVDSSQPKEASWNKQRC